MQLHYYERFFDLQLMQQDISSGLCTRVSGFEVSSGVLPSSLSNSYQRSSLTTMTEPVYNASSGLATDPQTSLFSFSSGKTLPQQHLQAAAASGASTSFVPHQHQQAASIPQSVSSVPQQHPHTNVVYKRLMYKLMVTI